MKILVDMNLSPFWVPVLERHRARAANRLIMGWAASEGHVVFTHDPDFGTTVALPGTSGPSVVQVRAQDVLPNHLEQTVATALRQHQKDLNTGALVLVDETRSRVRLLPW